MKPQVLFLDHSGALGGGELSLLDIARHYREHSQVVLLTDGPFRERLEQAGVAVEVLPIPPVVSGIRRAGSGTLMLRAVPEIFKVAQRVARMSRDYNVLYANSQKALVIGALAGKLAGKPVVWHLRDMLIEEHFGRKQRLVATTLANRLTARVIANSEATAKSFVRGGGRAELVRVVYNGVNSTAFEPVEPAKLNALKAELGLAGVPVVGVFSRLAPWKGQHVLLEALVHLPGVHALFVGDAIFGEHTYAKALRDQSKSLGLVERVHFAGFRQDIPQLMQLSDVVVHTSVAPEPFGRVIVEGMLARRPVVATRAGAAVEIIEDGVSGVLVPPRNAAALARALASLLTDPTKARAMAEAGYAAALNRFSLEAMIEGVEQQLQEVASISRVRSGRLGRP